MDDMYRIATMVQRESNSKASKMIMAIDKEDKYNEGDEDNIAAFHNYKASIWSKNQNNYSNGQSKSGNCASSQSNTNHIGKHCYYCKLQNHCQEKC